MILASVICICITVLAWQWSRFFQMQEAKHIERFIGLSDELQEKLKAFDEIKKQVDTLSLKAGFSR